MQNKAKVKLGKIRASLLPRVSETCTAQCLGPSMPRPLFGKNKANAKIGKMGTGLLPRVSETCTALCLGPSKPWPLFRKNIEDPPVAETQSTPLYIDSGVVPSEWNESRELPFEWISMKNIKDPLVRKPLTHPPRPLTISWPGGMLATPPCESGQPVESDYGGRDRL